MKRALLQVHDPRAKRPKARVWEWTDASETTKEKTTTNPKSAPSPSPSTDERDTTPRIAIDYYAYPHIFESIFAHIVLSKDASTLRSLRATCHSIRRSVDALFLSDIEYRLSPAEVEGPYKLAAYTALPPKSRLLGLEWNGTPASAATIEVGPCACHAVWDKDRGADCPVHVHEARVRSDALSVDYVRFIGDPHAHSADWAIGADTEIHVVDMFPRRHNGWTRMNRRTLDSRQIALQAATGVEADTDAGPSVSLSAQALGALGLSGVGRDAAEPRTTKRRILNFRIHEHYEWLFDYCMLPPSDCADQVILVTPYAGEVQLEAPEDVCDLCSEASGCRTDPTKLIHVKPDPTLHLNPAEGPLFGLITSLADDWTHRLGDLLKSPVPPPVSRDSAGRITFVGVEAWKDHWVQSRPSDVLLPDEGGMREKIKMCFYWRCLSNIQDAVLERLTDEIDYTTGDPRIKRWWDFVYRFINKEECFRFLSAEEYAEERGEREVELVMAEDA